MNVCDLTALDAKNMGITGLIVTTDLEQLTGQCGVMFVRIMVIIVVGPVMKRKISSIVTAFGAESRDIFLHGNAEPTKDSAPCDVTLSHSTIWPEPHGSVPNNFFSNFQLQFMLIVHSGTAVTNGRRGHTASKDSF